MSFISSYIAINEHFNYIVIHFRCMLYMLSCCVLVGLDWVEPMMYLHLHIICSCIRTFIFLYSYILCVGTFLIVSLSLSLSLSLHSCVSLLLWHLNPNLLRPRTLCVLGQLLPLTLHHILFSSMMMKPKRTSWRTFVN